MTIVISLMAAALIACFGIIYEQDKTIKRQRKALIHALDWVEPEALVREDWLE